MKKDFFGSSPNILVSNKNYPKVNFGILSGEKLSSSSDDPKLWVDKNYSRKEILNLRTNLINANTQVHVKNFNHKLADISKEIALSKKYVDVEINLRKKPSTNFNLMSGVTTYGPSVEVLKASVTENPKINTQVNRVYEDTDMKAIDGLKYLYDKGYDERFLTKMLSAGSLGIQRKIVPTKWSITSVHDTLGKNIIEKIKNHAEIDYTLHIGNYLGNHFFILFFPAKWSYELFETYLPKKERGNTPQLFSDYEPFQGRKSYAKNTAGGYYSSRLSVVEYLSKIKRQGSALVIRYIEPEYESLGVWVVLHTVRKCLESKKIVFDSKEEMISFVKKNVWRKFKTDVNSITNKSHVLNNKTLFNFL